MDRIYFSLYFDSAYEIYSLGTMSLMAMVQSIVLIMESIWAAEYPRAYIPPTRPPILVPSTISIGMSMDSRYFSTPI